MKNLIRTFVFVLGIFVFQATVAHATGYNYRPADVYIKQQQEKSALEYRLQKLESSLSSNPSASLSTIESRIQQLKSERDTEINYIRGLYAQSGISNQIDAKVAEITAKYASQISALESQKSSYQSQADVQAKEAEITELKLKIKQLEYDMQTKEYEQALKNMDALKNRTVTPSAPDVYVPNTTDPYTIFKYMDSLSLQGASDVYQKLLKTNPTLAEKVNAVYDEVYPNGKPGTWVNDEYKASQNTATKQVQKVPVVEKKPVTKEAEIKAEPVIATSTQVTPAQEVKAPEPIKQTFVQKVFGFFEKLAFWE